jgi:hypothetical protein
MQFLIPNIVCWGTSVVPKLPSMHGVRIFGVNHKQMD